MNERVTFLLALAWAASIGISVPFEVCNTTFLNKHASNKDLHGFYVAQLAVFIGGLQLVPLSINKTPWLKPSKWWSVLGGACSVLGFITVSASPLLGAQLLLMTQLVGLLGTFFILDLADGTVKLRDWRKFIGLAIVVLGVAIDNLNALKDSKGITGSWIFHFVGVFLSGVGYALQAKCNGKLAPDVGGPARAAVVSAIVNILFSAPIMFYIVYHEHVPLSLDTGYWPLWLVAGFQSAFYIGSMAKLPKLLGFTTCYMVVLGSKLMCSSAVDAAGLAGKVVAISPERAVSVVLVLVGATLFNAWEARRPQVCSSMEQADVEKHSERDGLAGEEISSSQT